MEINVGFRDDECQECMQIAAKYIMFNDKTCYLRNMGKESLEASGIIQNPKYFIPDVCYQISHESLHITLLVLVGEEACHLLNNIDGKKGHLLNAPKFCDHCGKRIIEYNGYIAQGCLFWHKKCHEIINKNS